jgi:hypothetical protein
MKNIKIKGSILVFALLAMFLILVVAIGLSSVSVSDLKTSSATDRSVRTFQIADSGAEFILEKIKSGEDTVDELDDVSGIVCDISDGVAVIRKSFLDGNCELSFKNQSGNFINSCSSTDIIASVKSAGFYAGYSRAIEVKIP